MNVIPRILTTALALACHALSAAEFHVAPTGNDANPGTEAKPFATLERARDEIRKSKPAGGATVSVRGGLYSLPHGILFEKQDSGTEEAPILYRAFQDERPVLIGGRQISRFAPHQDRILMAEVGSQGFQGVRFRQLFFDGKRQIPARYPNFDTADPWMGGWAYVDGKPKPAIWAVDGPEDSKRTFAFKPFDARTWAHPEDGWVLISPKHEWDYGIRPIASVDALARTITLAADCNYTIRPTDPYVVMGLFEELDAPGEWYLDPRTGRLYFWPPNPCGIRPSTRRRPTVWFNSGSVPCQPAGVHDRMCRTVRGGHGRSNRLPGPRLHGPERRQQIRKRDPGSPGHERRD